MLLPVTLSDIQTDRQRSFDVTCVLNYDVSLLLEWSEAIGASDLIRRILESTL